MTVENKKGRFGKFGGQYVPEIVMPVLNQLEEAYENIEELLISWQICGNTMWSTLAVLPFVLCR